MSKGKIALNYENGNPVEYLIQVPEDSLSSKELQDDHSFLKKNRNLNPFSHFSLKFYNFGILYLFFENHTQWAMIQMDTGELMGLKPQMNKKIIACHGFSEKQIQNSIGNHKFSLGSVICSH
ncbi:MAG: hypothetical protein KDD52_03945 [Bdellovibrionales bacterium]|nr:hypothetical protein [Bdellovibrionales bacterium]